MNNDKLSTFNVIVLDSDDRIYNDLKSSLASGCGVYKLKNASNIFDEIRKRRISVAVINLDNIDFNTGSLNNWIKNFSSSLQYLLISKNFTESDIITNMENGAFQCLKTYSNPKYLSVNVINAAEKELVNSNIENLTEKLNQQSVELMSEKDIKISLLHEAGKITGSVFHLETLLRMIIHLISNTMKVQICSVMLVNEETGELEIKEAMGLDQSIIESTSIRNGEGISGWVLKEGKSLLVLDIEEDGRFKERNVERYLNKSLLSVPLKIKDKVMGVLNVNNKINEKPFNEEDKKVLESIASQVSTIIENARLIDHLVTAKTEVKKAHDQLIRSEKFAAIGKLAASLSHEINNPLTSIYGRIQQLMRIPKDEETGRILVIIKGEVERISRILNNLLNFAKITKAKAQLCDLNHIIDNALNLLNPELKRNNIIVNKELDKRLPKTLIDGDQFMQVVINIVLNANRAMSGSASPENKKLDIATRQSGEWIELVICDSGIGIPKEKMANIFDPFFTNWENGGGTGLGLSVSRNIIENFGGEIDVVSKEGRGTTFTVKLPYNL